MTINSYTFLNRNQICEAKGIGSITDVVKALGVLYLILLSVSQNRQHDALIETAYQRNSMLVHFSYMWLSMGVENSTSAKISVIVNGSDHESEPPLTLQTASRALWGPKYCEAAERIVTNNVR